MRRTGRHRDTEVERFARVIDADPRSGPPEPGRTPDPLDEAIDRLVRVVERVRSGGAATASSEYKHRFREVLLAHAAADRSVPDAAAGHRVRYRPVVPCGRWFVGACATAIVMVLLAAATLLISHGALPGDALYAVKRRTESVQLALARGSEARADRHLDFARARAHEVREIVDRLDGLVPSAADSGRILTTADDMDAETRSGVALVTAHAVSEARVAELTGLLTWAADQRAILDPLADQLPAGLAERVGDSLRLLALVRGRATALRIGLDCSCLGHPDSDPLGPLPCERCVPPGQPDERVSIPSDPSGPTAPVPAPTAAGEPATTPPSTHPPESTPPADTPSLPGPLIPGLPGLPEDIPVLSTPYGGPTDEPSIPPPDSDPLPPGPLVPGLADGPESPPDLVPGPDPVRPSHPGPPIHAPGPPTSPSPRS